MVSEMFCPKPSREAFDALLHEIEGISCRLRFLNLSRSASSIRMIAGVAPSSSALRPRRYLSMAMAAFLLAAIASISFPASSLWEYGTQRPCLLYDTLPAAHNLRRGHNRVDDLLVARAAAQVSRNGRSHLHDDDEGEVGTVYPFYEKGDQEGPILFFSIVHDQDLLGPIQGFLRPHTYSVSLLPKVLETLSSD